MKLFLISIIGVCLLILFIWKVYEIGYEKGYSNHFHQINKSWQLVYDSNHCALEDGFFIISDMPYEGWIEWYYKEGPIIGEMQLSRAWVISKTAHNYVNALDPTTGTTETYKLPGE